MVDKCWPGLHLSLFIGWVVIFLERGSVSGLCPEFRRLRIGADFFIFESTRLRDKIAVVVRMGGERRFASLLRIGAPRTILKQLFWRGGVLCGDSFDFFWNADSVRGFAPSSEGCGLGRIISLLTGQQSATAKRSAAQLPSAPLTPH